jgi:hypothetical protein
VKNIFIVAGALLVLVACDAKEEAPLPPEERERIEVVAEDLPDMPAEHPPVDGLDVLSRGPRRMSVDQIERSVEKIGDLPAGTVVLDQSLALALGRPDYLRVTEESLEPSPLFMKFMMDLSGYICTALSDYDPMRPQEARVLTRFNTPDENIRYMLLRFTGIEGPEAEPYVVRLKEVYDTGLLGARAEKGGGEAVCMALFTSPEFLIY